MTEKQLLQKALEEKLFSAEKRVSILRLILSIFNTVVYLIGWSDAGYDNFAIGIIVLALSYSSIMVAFEVYKKFRFLHSIYFTTIGDGLLIALWIAATGYMDSPFYVLWYVSIIAVAMRYSLLETAVSAFAYLLLYLGVFFVDPQNNIDLADLLVRVGYIPLAGMLGMFISIEIADQIQDKVKVIRGESALKEAHDHLETKVEERTMQLSIMNKDLVDSMNYAKRIQAAILPSASAVKHAFHDSFLIHLARDVISGDFYWIHKTEDRTWFAIVDCTGHGVPGALMSMIANSLLNKIIVENGVSEAGKALKKMDIALATLVKKEMTDDAVNDGMDLFLGSIDTSSNRLEYASAYGYGLVLRDDSIIELNTSKSSVGGLITSDEKYFDTHSIELEKGDQLYFFTDGFQDQFGGPKGKKFLRKNFLNLIQKQAGVSSEKQEENITKSFLKWKGTEPQTDDVTVLGIRY
ncbi:MAG: SpoIIE family protein phosphatase [Flavobacteriales bacterium]|nr:SpoIIE family protein phosphatase [Flavobacteriales bacterium]